MKWIQETLTKDWFDAQGGQDVRARRKFLEICQTLELDRKAQVDLVLLAQQGHARRTEFNEILWELLSTVALDPEYRDLSNFVSSSVGQVRRVMGRHPWNHPRRTFLAWRRYTTMHNKSFDLRRVP